MYKQNKRIGTSLEVNQSQEGETIEQKLERVVQNKEPISDGAPLVFTERKDGVLPGYDIRTDRFEVAVEAMDKIHKSDIAKREAKLKGKEEEGKDGGAESIGGTDGDLTK